MRVADNWAWVRLMFLHDLGLADAYIASEIDFDDLSAFFEVGSLHALLFTAADSACSS